jgi:hypothetical protein
MIHCKAAVTDGNGQFSIKEISVADPTGDEILVKIMAAGICHTDWDAQYWGKPLILGQVPAARPLSGCKGSLRFQQHAAKQPSFCSRRHSS